MLLAFYSDPMTASILCKKKTKNKERDTGENKGSENKPKMLKNKSMLIVTNLHQRVTVTKTFGL